MTEPIEPGTATEPVPNVDAAPDSVAPTASSTGTTVVSTGAGASRGRWFIALGIAAGALAIAIAAAFLLASRPTPEALTYIPGNAAVVAELRLDLPGDQLQKVGNLLAHFPGFKDQSTLTQKIDETLSRLVGSATKGKVDYATQVQPWIAGPLFAGGTPSSRAATPTPSATGSELPAVHDVGAFVVVATTDGTASCSALFKGVTPSTETYQGVTIASAADGSFACAIDKRFGVLGTPAMVKAALDAHAAHAGMDTNGAYKTARDALGGDRLATVFIAKAAMTAATVPSGLPLASGGTGAGLGGALERLPEWTMAGLNAEDDAIVADVVTAPIPASSAASGSPLPSFPPAHSSTMAPLLPADTAALIEVHGAGIALQTALAQLRTNPTLGPALGQVDGSLALLGGADQLVGWINDVGIVIEPDGTSVAGGIVLTADGEATASAKADQIRGLLSLAGLGGGADITQSTIAGVKVTTVDLGDLSSLLKATGTGVSLPTGAHIVISFAAKGSALIVGGGEGFVRHILEGSGGTLVDATGYKHAMTRASAENLGQVYVGAPSLLSIAETFIPAADQAAFKSNVEPYLTPFEAVIVTATTDHGSAHVRFVATVK